MEITVRDYMENKLAGLGFEVDEFKRAVDFAIRKESERPYLRQETKDGNYIPLNDCWDTDVDNYTKDSLHSLYKCVEFHAFMWCLNELHSRK